MKTIKDFDYDLFKDKNGKCYIRIKRTKEVCEVSLETFNLLNAEAVKAYRKDRGIPIYDVHNGKRTIVGYARSLSIDCCEQETESAWISDHGSAETEMMDRIRMNEFFQLLTDRQYEVLQRCLIGGMSYASFSREKGVSETAIQKTVKQIRKKAKNFFDEGWD